MHSFGRVQMSAEERAEERERAADQVEVQKESTAALLPESLDYDPVENDVFRAEHYHQRETRHFYGYGQSQYPNISGF